MFDHRYPSLILAQGGNLAGSAASLILLCSKFFLMKIFLVVSPQRLFGCAQGDNLFGSAALVILRWNDKIL